MARNDPTDDVAMLERSRAVLIAPLLAVGSPRAISGIAKVHDGP